MDSACFLIKNKPVGRTSRSMVSEERRLLSQSVKVGHIGTLDPFASGILPIGLGKALKLENLMHKIYPKTYWAKGVFGESREGGDCTGEVLNSAKPPSLSSSQVLELEQKFQGIYWQIPPMLSAKKWAGKPLYYWKRNKNIEVERTPIQRNVLSLKILSYYEKYLEFRVTVSSGTYVRKLFEDMAIHLNTFGYLQELVREEIGPFKLNNISLKPYTIMEAFPLETISLTPKAIRDFTQGKDLNLSQEFNKKFLYSSLNFLENISYDEDKIKKLTQQLYWVCEESSPQKPCALWKVDETTIESLVSFV